MREFSTWQSLKEALDQLWAVPEVDQPAYLERMEAEDPNLYALLRQAVDAKTPSLMSLRIAGSAPFQPLSPGTQIGRYRIERFIARGGMGAVYEATHPILKSVALKVVRPELNLREFTARFEHERDILASLRHPYIAYLLDAGTTEDGLPFVAMEYVQGIPLHLYCQQEQLSREELLILFQRICEAVAFAHRNLIIHQDIKPVNILVTEDGNPKLLDFGIAKLMDESRGDGQILQKQVFTPEYASPEQWAGQTVGTSTDIYSLGVVLYEMLTGSRPHTGDKMSLQGLQKSVCEGAPTAPHLRKTKQADQNGAWQGSVPRDLSLICMRALEKNPENRYATVDGFREDITRFLKVQPVNAKPATTAYILGTFIKRHRASVIGVTILIAVFLVSILSFTLQRQEIRTQTEMAQTFDDMLQNIFQVHDPGLQYRNPLTMSNILDNALEELAQLREQNPEAVTSFYETVAKAYQNMGDSRKALAIVEEILDIHREMFGPVHPRTLEAQANFSDMLRARGEYHSARAQAEAVLANREIADWETVIKARLVIAACDLEEDEAETSFEAYQGLLADVIANGEDPKRQAQCFNGMGLAAYRLSRFEEAETYHLRCVSLIESYSEEEPLEFMPYYNNLGLAYRARNKLDAAQQIFETMQRQLADHGIESGRMLLEVHANLGLIRRAKGERKAAFDHFEAQLQLTRLLYGEQTRETSRALNRLGLVHMDYGQWEQATLKLLEALTIRKTMFGPDNSRVAETHNNLALAAIGRGEWDDARDHVQCAKLIRSDLYEPCHRSLLNTEQALVMLELASGQTTNTLKRLTFLFACNSGPLGEGPSTEHLYLLGRYYLLRDQTDLAQSAFLQALEQLEQTHSAQHFQIERILKNLVETQRSASQTSHTLWEQRLLETEWMPASQLYYLTETRAKSD